MASSKKGTCLNRTKIGDIGHNSSYIFSNSSSSKLFILSLTVSAFPFLTSNMICSIYLLLVYKTSSSSCMSNPDQGVIQRVQDKSWCQFPEHKI